MLSTVSILVVGCFVVCVAVLGLRYFTGAGPASSIVPTRPVGSRAQRMAAGHGSKR